MPELQGRLSSVDFQFRNFVNIVTKLKEFRWFSISSLFSVSKYLFRLIFIQSSYIHSLALTLALQLVRYSSIETFNYSLGFNTWLDSGKLQLHVVEKYWILERALLKVFLKIEHLTFNTAIQLIFVFTLTS